MISRLRFLFWQLLPNNLVFKLIRTLPEIVNFTAKFVQGIDTVHDQDKNFLKIYRQARSRIMLDKKRAFILYKCSLHCKSVPGNYAELGVYRGGGSYLIAETMANNKILFCFDTFEGFPSVHEKDLFKAGELDDTSLQDVKEFLSSQNVKFFKGPFPETLKRLKKDAKFAFVHIDFDLYEPTLAACEHFYSRVSKGGVMLFDDYGFLSCPGVRDAVDEFFLQKNEEIIYMPSGQALVVKI